MKERVLISVLCLAALGARAEVRVFVEDVGGVAWIRYECSAGEIVRAFGLDVTVDRGRIVGVSDYFRGESTPEAQGYGIFPTAFRDRISPVPGTDPDWGASEYTPVAEPADDPAATLPGLFAGGVTLEFGALWDPAVPDSIPGPRGTLCALQLSEGAKVAVTANASRRGVVFAGDNDPFAVVFEGAPVGPLVTGVTLAGGILTIAFHGGELETATSLQGEWVGTGQSDGRFAAPIGPDRTRFFRVRGR